MAVRIKIKVLSHAENLPLPHRATIGSSGVDIMAAIGKGCELLIEPGEVTLVPTGLKVAIPRGYEWQIRPRSGNALRYAVTVLNTPGTIDSDYRGEVKIILANLGKSPFRIRHGDRIAQAVLTEVSIPDFSIVDILPETNRGEGGFGHSGK